MSIDLARYLSGHPPSSALENNETSDKDEVSGGEGWKEVVEGGRRWWKGEGGGGRGKEEGEGGGGGGVLLQR